MHFPSTKTLAYTCFRTWLYVSLIALYLAAKVGSLALGIVLSVLSLAASSHWFTPEQFGTLIASEVSRWGKVARDTGAKAE
jgi:hypothetical protein